jgi:hypothetical protein
VAAGPQVGPVARLGEAAPTVAGSRDGLGDEAGRRPGLDRLAADLASGRWHERHRDLAEEYDAGYRLLIAGR